MSKGVLRGGSLNYKQLMRISFILLALEVVLIGFVMNLVYSKRRVIKITEKAVSTLSCAIINDLIIYGLVE